jgi:pimeloyl-ACP methyl ester carboxylesterase
MIEHDAHTRTLRLHDGRRLAWTEWGDETGAPLVYLHGTPGSRYERHYDPNVYSEAGVRAIVPDRPGYGLSDRQPGRTLLDHAQDIAQLADHLGLGRFAMLGNSGGGPFAIACGYALPERVTAVGVMSGVGRLDLPGAKEHVPFSDVVLYGMATYAPRVMDLSVRALAWLARARPDFVMERFAHSLSTSDRMQMARKELVELFQLVFTEAFRRGARATVEDYAIFRKPWGFALTDVELPVFFWHGAEDTMVTLGQAQMLATGLPNARLTVYPGEGHFLFPEHAPEILATLRDAT